MTNSVEHRAVEQVESVVTIPDVPPVRRPKPVLFYLSAGWLAFIALAALLAAFLPIAPYESAIGPGRLAPSMGSLDMLLGTDTYGRSMLSRMAYGGQVSLTVGAVAAGVGIIAGSFIGLVSGYFRGKLDSVTGLLVDVALAFPPLILLMSLTAVLTPSLSTVLVGLSLLAIPTFARLARSATIATCSREFVKAAKNMGASDTRILLREILPNIVGPVLAYLPVVMAAMVVAEGSLSFLGLGIPPPTPSWGGAIAEGKDALALAPHLVAIPSLVVFLTVFSLNQAGDYLRMRLDSARQS